MNKKIIAINIIILVLFGGIAASGIKVEKNLESNLEEFSIKQLTENPDAVDDELIIGYKKPYYGAILELCGSTGADPVDWINETSLAENEEGKKLRYVKLDLSGVGNISFFEFMINNFLATEEFDFAEPNYNVYTNHSIPNDPYWEGVDSDLEGSQRGVIEDFEHQWGPKMMNANDAWDKTRGNGITVAVLDTGFDFDHEDKANSYVWNSRDFVDNDHSPDDYIGHGTHCAGIIAAKMNNEKGIAGVAPGCTIMPVRVLGGHSNSVVGVNWDISRGIIYAATNGADIISMSFGGPIPSILMDAAIFYARVIKKVFLVTSSGNEANSYMSYPARNRHVYSVGSINSDGKLSSFSNHGFNLDFVAPGHKIISLKARGNHKEYVAKSGTSMACPHVAAAAALYMAESGIKKPSKVYKALEDSCIDMGDSFHYGNGLIDLKTLVRNAKNVNLKHNHGFEILKNSFLEDFPLFQQFLQKINF